MTPLAHRIVKQLTLPKKQREPFHDNANLLSRMVDVHCFEVSEVMPAVNMLQDHIYWSTEFDQRASFLPAPKTWIESKIFNGQRCAVLLEDAADGRSVNVVRATECLGKLYSFNDGSLSLTALPHPDFCQPGAGNLGRHTTYSYHASLLATLAIINTPRIIGRRQHMPHRGLEKRLVGTLGMQGKFPLHAWTEIKLEVTPPQDMSQDGVHEAHLTGQRALHFCRAHLRIKMGKLEIVRSHWRGDASLGIKRSRYKLVA